MSYLEEAKSLLEAEKTTFSLLLDKLCELKREHGNLKTEIKLGLSEDMKTLWQIFEVEDKLKSRIVQSVNKLTENKLKIKNLREKDETNFLIFLNELCELEYQYGVSKAKVRHAFRVGYGAGLSVGFRRNIEALSEIPIAADKIKSRIKRRVKELASSNFD
jgi:hypothetical protein